MKRYFDPLPTKLPIKSQTRGKLLRELRTLPEQVFPTIEWSQEQIKRIEAIQQLLEADLAERRLCKFQTKSIDSAAIE